MHWITIFDLAQAGYRNWWFPASSLVFVGVGVVETIRYHRRDPVQRVNKFNGRFALLLSPFAVLWGIEAFTSTYSEYTDLRDRLSSGRFQTIEGTVRSFQSLEKVERFDVKDVHFEYSDYLVQAGYHSQSGERGPLHNGVYAHIDYADGKILRLKIRELERKS